MRKSVPTWQMVGFIFTGVLGTLLHFLFEWTGENIIAALFSAVNESIWEHTKLLFYPMVLFALAEYKAWGREVLSFWCIKLIGILTGLILIPVLYYTYTGILGISADWFNITIFFIAAAAAYFLETKLFEKEISCRIPTWAAVAVLCILAIVYTALTFYPPLIPFFSGSGHRRLRLLQNTAVVDSMNRTENDLNVHGEGHNAPPRICYTWRVNSAINWYLLLLTQTAKIKPAFNG